MPLNRSLLPQPADYYEGRRLTLKGPKNAVWKTTRCEFHGGANTMNIHTLSGGFHCWNCPASGGDVVAYEMLIAGVSFEEAARRLNAWTGGGDAPQRHKPNRLSARDALLLIANEATLIAFEGSRLGRGITLTASDLEMVRKAAGRINHALGAI